MVIDKKCQHISVLMCTCMIVYIVFTYSLKTHTPNLSRWGEFSLEWEFYVEQQIEFICCCHGDLVVRFEITVTFCTIIAAFFHFIHIHGHTEVFFSPEILNLWYIKFSLIFIKSRVSDFRIFFSTSQMVMF